MLRERIISEIKKLAKESGSPPGRAVFERELVFTTQNGSVAVGLVLNNSINTAKPW